MGYLKNVRTTDEVNVDTGEITPITSSHTYRVKASVDEFYMVFCKAVDFHDELSRSELRLLMHLNKHSVANTNMVQLTGYMKDRFAEAMGISSKTLSNTLNLLVKGELIISKGKGAYLINPHYAWKGSLNNRDKAINEYEIKFSLIPIAKGININQNIK